MFGFGALVAAIWGWRCGYVANICKSSGLNTVSITHWYLEQFVLSTLAHFPNMQDLNNHLEFLLKCKFFSASRLTESHLQGRKLGICVLYKHATYGILTRPI